MNPDHRSQAGASARSVIQLPPKAPSWTRWRSLARSPYSLLRALQYEAVRGVALSGRVLDVGGDRRSAYHTLFRGSPEFFTINLSEQTQPDFRFNLEEPLPLESESFEHLISFNTFEHLRNDELAIREAVRVLKRGGTFHIVVPFLYRVHGSPRDFSRHTPEWWGEVLTSAEAAQVRIEPLVWDRLNTGLELTGREIRLMRLLTLLPALIDLKGMIKAVINSRAACEARKSRLDQLRADASVGWYISGAK